MPVSTLMIEKLSAKLENPPIARRSSCAYPSFDSSWASSLGIVGGSWDGRDRRTRRSSRRSLRRLALVAEVRLLLVHGGDEDEEDAHAGHDHREEVEILRAHQLVGRHLGVRGVQGAGAGDGSALDR